jgi:transcription antitermination protein NusB
MAVNARRRARIAAFQALFERDTSSHDAREAIGRIADHEHLSDEAASFASALIESVLGQQDELDRMIGEAAPVYPVEQLSPIDRNILRLAISEMLGDNGTPVKVAINEAVELAKSFGSDKSAKFINGALGYVARQHPELENDPAVKRG